MATRTSSGAPQSRPGILMSYIELMRPANIITAFADIIAGFAAVGGYFFWQDGQFQVQPEALPLAWLLLSTFGLYGGGVVFNDFFDADLDARERPERPIPSGRVSGRGAGILGGFLLLVGMIAALQVTAASGIAAGAIALLVLIYDKWAKHHTLAGPLLMGACRGGNLLLGATLLPAALGSVWFLGFIPLAYIAAITLVSQGEVHGGSRSAGFSAVGIILMVLVALAGFSVRDDYHLLTALPFLLLFGIMVLPAFIKAARRPTAEYIRTAIKRGVLSLILLNSTLAAGFSGLVTGIIVLLLLPLSMLVSKLFKVT